MHLEENKPLAPFTTIGLGGPARWFVSCNHFTEIVEALKWARSHNHSVFILGGGSNSLISDQGFAGVVIHINLKGIDWRSVDCVRVSAGEGWDSLVQATVTRGCSGLECLSGIPGTVGSTPIQNVGAYGQEVKDTILNVHALNRSTLEPVSFSNQQCDFSYRMSRFKGVDRDQFVITAVEFQLTSDTFPKIHYPELERAVHASTQWQDKNVPQIERLELIRSTVLKIRSSKGMVVQDHDPDSHSLGSFFVNPMVTTKEKDHVFATAASQGIQPPPNAFPAGDDKWKLSAAWLIEHSGIRKGERLGGAAVSSKHSLALINCGTATTADVLKLADKIRQQVKNKFGIELQQEPELIR